MPNIERHGNSWSYRYSRTVKGERQYIRRTGYPSYDAAEKAYQAEMDRLKRNPIDTEDYTLEEWIERWYVDHASLRVAETTLAKYRSGIEKIIEAIGSVPLAKLNIHHIQPMIAEWARSHKPATVHSMFEPLRASLNDAVKLSVINYNPCAAVTLPRRKTPPKATLTSRQVSDMLDEAKGANYYIPLLLAVMCGLRRGEICALRWSDVDFEHGFLSVRKARVRRMDGVVVEKDAKSDASTRVVDIPPDLLAELKDTKEKQTPQSEYACALKGEPLKPDYITRAVSRLVARMGYEKMSVHGQRHTHASIMLSLGVHPKIVQERLGHKKISTTLDTYSHVLPSMQRESARILEEEIRGAPKDAPTT